MRTQNGAPPAWIGALCSRVLVLFQMNDCVRGTLYGTRMMKRVANHSHADLQYSLSLMRATPWLADLFASFFTENVNIAFVYIF